MVGKLTRREFLRQFGFYSAGLAALYKPDVATRDTYAKHFSVSRLVFESLACFEQLKQIENNSRIVNSPEATGKTSEIIQA